MADDYIDYFECLEYGDHFLDQSKQLVGLSPLVDVTALRALVDTSTKGVAAELAKQGIKRSDVRSDRKDVSAETTALRKEIDRFYSFLGSLDDSESVDKAAFFPGGNLGKLAQVKPADLVQKAKQVLDGFDAPANAKLPDASKWKTKLETARTALAQAISGKGTTTVQSIQGTAALVAAREGFLTSYNGVAKRLILGLLIHLDRRDEQRLFFKDLQVNEDSAQGATPPTPPTPPAPPATP